MMQKPVRLLAPFFALCILSQPLQADPIVVTDSPQGYPRATAILGLDLMGMTFSVTFHPGVSYAALYSSSAPFFLGNQSGAEEARDAINMALNGLSPNPTVNAQFNAYGGTSSNFLIPYGLVIPAESADSARGFTIQPMTNDWHAVGNFNWGIRNSGSTVAYTTFEKQSAAPVPEPSSAADHI